MKPNVILYADLLDIIFENKNKEYGAYELRRSYNKRMMIALYLMAALCCLFFCFSLIKTNTHITGPFIVGGGTVISPMPHDPMQPQTSVTHPAKQKSASEKFPPLITKDSVNINKTTATPAETATSSNSTDTSGTQEPDGSDVGKAGGTGVSKGDTVLAAKENKSVVNEVAEIMPQYPGGTNALLAFLKKNLHAPDDIAEGDVISVKVRFVVKYDGSLQSFDVIQSGGSVFDNEVIRVLKKMPTWIPGKNNGEDVSVYYVVPVKFASEN